MKKNNKSMDEIRDIVARLEAVVEELKEIGCYGSIRMSEVTIMGEERPITLLMNNENMPKGKARYEKFDVKGAYHEVDKIVKVGNVEFHAYLSKEEATKELFGE